MATHRGVAWGAPCGAPGLEECSRLRRSTGEAARSSLLPSSRRRARTNAPSCRGARCAGAHGRAPRPGSSRGARGWPARRRARGVCLVRGASRVKRPRSWTSRRDRAGRAPASHARGSNAVRPGKFPALGPSAGGSSGRASTTAFSFEVHSMWTSRRGSPIGLVHSEPRSFASGVAVWRTPLDGGFTAASPRFESFGYQRAGCSRASAGVVSRGRRPSCPTPRTTGTAALPSAAFRRAYSPICWTW